MTCAMPKPQYIIEERKDNLRKNAELKFKRLQILSSPAKGQTVSKEIIYGVFRIAKNAFTKDQSYGEKERYATLFAYKKALEANNQAVPLYVKDFIKKEIGSQPSLG